MQNIINGYYDRIEDIVDLHYNIIVQFSINVVVQAHIRKGPYSFLLLLQIQYIKSVYYDQIQDAMNKPFVVPTACPRSPVQFYFYTRNIKLTSSKI